MARQNKYPAKCYYCGQMALPGQGCIERRKGGVWGVIHNASYAGGSCIEKQRKDKEEKSGSTELLPLPAR
jgi:ribosomal protein L24E